MESFAGEMRRKFFSAFEAGMLMKTNKRENHDISDGGYVIETKLFMRTVRRI